MFDFVVCHHIKNRFNTGKLGVYDKILQLYVKALLLKSLCIPTDFILPFISTMFRHRSPSSSAPHAASLTLAHISLFISRHFLTEQHKQHDEHVQRDGWLWQRQSERRDPAQHRLQLQNRCPQRSGEGVSQPGHRRREEAAHRRVRVHTDTKYRYDECSLVFLVDEWFFFLISEGKKNSHFAFGKTFHIFPLKSYFRMGNMIMYNESVTQGG